MLQSLIGSKKKLLLIAFLILVLVLIGVLLNKFTSLNIFKTLKKETVELPQGFPEIPVYPGARLSSFYDEEMEGEIEYQYKATWESKDSVPKIMEWYQNRKEDGWIVIKPSSDLGATGAQDAVFEYRRWKIYIVVQKRDDSEPSYIYVRLDSI